MKRLQENPVFLVGITITLWAFAGVTLKLIANSKTFTVMAIALAAASFVIFLYYKRTSKERPPSPLNVKFIFYSFCGYAVYWFCFLHAVEHYDEMVSPPIILNYTWPFFTGLFTILLYKRQKADVVFYLSLFCGFLGIIILASEGSLANLNFSYSLTGLLFGICTGMSYGLFSSYSSTLENPVDSARYLLLGTIFGAVVLGIVGWYKYGDTMFDLTPLDWIIAFLVGFLLDSIGYILWVRAQAVAAQQQTDITKVVSLANYLPLFSLTLIALIFPSERAVIVQPYFLVAFVLVFLSSVIPSLRK